MKKYKHFTYNFFFFYIPARQVWMMQEKVLRNEKIKTTDEFLVEKRDPLVFPPDFDKIPEPGTKEKKNKSEGREN